MLRGASSSRQHALTLDRSQATSVIALRQLELNFGVLFRSFLTVFSFTCCSLSMHCPGPDSLRPALCVPCTMHSHSDCFSLLPSERGLCRLRRLFTSSLAPLPCTLSVHLAVSFRRTHVRRFQTGGLSIVTPQRLVFTLCPSRWCSWVNLRSL